MEPIHAIEVGTWGDLTQAAKKFDKFPGADTLITPEAVSRGL